MNQEWFKRLFATDVAIARGGWSWGVSPSKPSGDSIPIRQNSISTSGPRERPGPVDVGQAGVDGEQDKQEEGEEVAEDVHPELCWRGKGQLWTVGTEQACVALIGSGSWHWSAQTMSVSVTFPYRKLLELNKIIIKVSKNFSTGSTSAKNGFLLTTTSR